MILEKLHIIITIIAAIVMTVVCMLMKFPLEYSVLVVVLTIVGFYVLGSIIKIYVFTKIIKKDIPVDNTNNEENNESDEVDNDSP